jgi:hypothetical protein
MAAENIHCALGLNFYYFLFRNLQSKMRLSKLQKLDPSAIDKCAMVFVPPLALEKKKKLRRFVNTIAIYKRAQH